ncbi:MAG: hypothetical protein NZ553_16460 [Caldilinea sp.]|nr:hypothetical protein [Caldilinea sp.]MDW8442072.1 hypothetical protein [Caldilineaceae bacterium]
MHTIATPRHATGVTSTGKALPWHLHDRLLIFLPRLNHLPRLINMHFDLPRALYDRRTQRSPLHDKFRPPAARRRRAHRSRAVRRGEKKYDGPARGIYVAGLAGIGAVGIGFDFIEFLFRHRTPEQQAALAAGMTEAHQLPGLTNPRSH